jgi:hypothetical protein
LKGYQDNYNVLGGSGNGLLMGVQPRTFLSSTGACTDGILSPYYYNWGITLGDGVKFPKQAMLITQTIQRTSNDAPEIVYQGSELPTVYYSCDFAKYAFYMPSKNYEWKAWSGNRDFEKLSESESYTYSQVTGYGNMRCNGPDPNTALCAATYYGGSSPLLLGGAKSGAGGCAANMVSNRSGASKDNVVHSRNVIFVVGNLGTINTALSQTIPKLNGVWGDF